MQASADFIGVAFHGMAVSHIDALCHVFVDGQMYNGFPASEVKSLGAKRNSIAAAFGGIVGRGVLLDIPRLRGVEWLEPGDAISPDELDAASAAQQVDGRARRHPARLHRPRRAARAARTLGPEPGGLAGLDAECIPWFHEHIARCSGATASPTRFPRTRTLAAPDSPVLLVGMGVHLLDNLQLGRLADACAREQRWEFLFVVLPLRIGGGTGSPVNPVAVL